MLDAFIQMSGGEYQITTQQVFEYLKTELLIDSNKIGDDLNVAVAKVVQCQDGLSLERFIDLFSPISAEIKEQMFNKKMQQEEAIEQFEPKTKQMYTKGWQHLLMSTMLEDLLKDELFK